MTNSVYFNGFYELSNEETMNVDGGGLFNEICKGVTSVFGGAIIKGAVSGALKGTTVGSIAGPAGILAGVIGGIVIACCWEIVF